MFFETQAGPPEQCSGGGSSYFEGTLEILEIDGAKVKFQLSDTAGFFFSQGNADGAYSALRCF